MGSKHKRKESISARLALLKPEDDAVVRRELGEERWVQDEKRGERVAMLRLHEGALPNSKIRRSFDRQLAALEGFSHPSVVEVYEGGTNDGQGRGFLISAGVEGKTLRELLADAPLPPQDAIGIAIDLLNGLAAGHSRWLVHGGISPESVLVATEEGRPRARFLHYGFTPVIGEARETSFGEARICLDYAAPESAKGEAVDPRADVYSVGALLFEMVVGRHPVPATGADPIRSRVLDQADVLPSGALEDSDLATRLKKALKRALAKNPSERFCSARSFALALSGAPLPSEDPFEDPWAWPEACPEGGSCAASGASIPALADRSWSRKQSDRPFRCRVSGKDFAGAEHWDSRGLCSRGGRHKPLPAPEGEAPQDVIYDDLLDGPQEEMAAPAEAPVSEPAPAEAPPAEAPPAEAAPAEVASDKGGDEASPPDTEKLDRRAALRELLKDDARVAGFLDKDEQSEAPPQSEPVPEPETEAAKDEDAGLVLDPVVPREERERSSSGRDLSDSTTIKVEEAFLDAWDGARRQTEAATTRMKRASTRAVGRPVSAEGEPLENEGRPMGRPQTSAPATTSNELFRFQVATVVLGIVVLMVGVRLNQETGVSAAQRALAAKNETEVRKGKVEYAAISTVLGQTKDQLKKVGEDLGSTKVELNRDKTRLKTQGAEIVDLKRKQSETTKTLKARTAALGRAELAKTALGVKLKTSETNYAAERSESSRLKKALASATGSLTQVRGVLKQSQSEVQETQAALAKASGELSASRASLTRARGSLAQAETESRSLRAARDVAQTALAKSEAKVAAQTRDLRLAAGERDRARAQFTKEAEARRRDQAQLKDLKTRLTTLEASVAELTRERSDLLVELADLEAEREQLDAEGLQLERWLREAEAKGRAAAKKGTAPSGQTTRLRLRSVAASGIAQDATALSLSLGERALAVVETATLTPFLEKAKLGEVLVTVRVRCQGGPPVLKLQGFLSAARVNRPSHAGLALTLQKVAAGEYRAWIRKDVLARYKAQSGSTGFGLLLVGGSNPSQVASVELRVSPLSEDARGLLERTQ